MDRKTAKRHIAEIREEMKWLHRNRASVVGYTGVTIYKDMYESKKLSLELYRVIAGAKQ